MNEIIKIPLYGGKFAIVDKIDGHLKNWGWCISRWGYAVRNTRDIEGRGKTVFMHHCVIGKPLADVDVDHIDSNKLNNRRSNLRVVSHRINSLNRKKRMEGKTSSKYPGVYRHKGSGTWIARVQINGKRLHLGTFRNEIDAHKIHQSKIGEIENGK